MAGSATGPGVIPTNGMPQETLAQTPVPNIVRATNEATMGPESFRRLGGPVNTNAPLEAVLKPYLYYFHISR